MKKIIAMLAVAASMTVGVIVAAPTAQSFAPDDWRTFVVCDTAKQASVDPIVSPGVKPSSHVHVFAGNTRTSEDPSYDRMVTPPLESSCELTRDTAAYWTPAARNKNTGAIRQPVQWNVYYVNPWKDSSMVAFPADFQAVSDKWEPHADGVRIWFDRVCWDGTLHMPSAALYKEHTRNRGSSGCPAGFGTLLPKMHYNLHFGFNLGPAWEPTSQMMGIGWHGDFWNTWDQATLEAIVEACLNKPAVVNGQGCASLDDRNVESELAARGVVLPPEPQPVDPAVQAVLDSYNSLTAEQQAAFRELAGI